MPDMTKEPAPKRARFELLYEQFSRPVWSYVARRAPADVVADVVSDTFTVCWRRIDAVPEDPLPWLIGIARRVLANHHRAESRRRGLEQRVAETSEHAAEMPVAHLEGIDPVLRSALMRLGEKDREIMLLVAWEELDQRQIARALGITHTAVRIRAMRARRRLARALEGSEAPGAIAPERERGPGDE